VLPEAWILGWEVHVFRAGRGSKGGSWGVGYDLGVLGGFGKPLGVRESRRVGNARMAV